MMDHQPVRWFDKHRAWAASEWCFPDAREPGVVRCAAELHRHISLDSDARHLSWCPGWISLLYLVHRSATWDRRTDVSDRTQDIDQQRQENSLLNSAGCSSSSLFTRTCLHWAQASNTLPSTVICIPYITLYTLTTLYPQRARNYVVIDLYIVCSLLGD